jgi:hypothetical protein
MSADTDVDRLFQLPLTEFTAARNALAASLKEAGKSDEAAVVKALGKPPVSAWAVNQLYWRHRKPFDQFMAAGEKLRRAQASQLAGKGGEMRGPMEARRDALADLVTRAAAVLRESGHSASPDLIRRITTTLEALATDGDQSGAPSPGRLTADVDPPGFEALSALLPAGRGKGRSAGSSRVLQFHPPPAKPAHKKLSAAEKKRRDEEERKERQKAAQAALREAERTLREAQKVLAEREGALRKAAERAKTAEKAKAALEKQFEKISTDADAARQEARRVASEAEEAAQAVQDAERTLEKARQDVTP